ncbi:MAG: ABC transporter ATP-binding protein [Thiomonas sp. 13-66-29]|jgi:branched-chain amino acid transport system ATP-binding protein|uniref:ABC transporter ATP-binding protein n=1 Tax=Thiomonas delicata TaxID=364030 RepID=UPI000B8E5846|nr:MULTISPECIES: ABC transporter ATP-binding protein [Thiomonas]OZB44863.1 MAG: ABC transporter ATP-binding protein [Thiomonas sp. 15-66-11]OZB64878.1 MAG: ABC transporter ATP-binding protein [Thiomonas sp. 13-66-29]
MPNISILRTRGLSKHFSGFSAVQNVDLDIAQGSIHALVGPNGAGKTTCFNLLSKFLQPSSGDIYYLDRNITKMQPADVARLGMVRSFQISATFPHMTLLENVRVGLQRHAGLAHQFWMSVQVLKRLDDAAMEFLDLVGLSAQAGQLAVNLPYGHKRALELATTLAMNPQLLLLDEPTQGLGHEDVEQVTNLIQRVAKGRTVLMVEHNMSVIAKICDRVTVMQRGQVLAEGSYDEVSRNPEVIAAYMGESEGALSSAAGANP